MEQMDGTYSKDLEIDGNENKQTSSQIFTGDNAESG
jgi:hypothetical protein